MSKPSGPGARGLLPKVFYLCPDHREPSWGVGMLYRHVAILRRHGFDAAVLHQRAPFRLTWLASDVPVQYAEHIGVSPASTDVLVVPDVLAASTFARQWPGRRTVFVQGAFTILPGLAGATDYRSLGYTDAMAVLPSVQAVVARHFGVPAFTVPPCIAQEFFVDRDSLTRGPRERRILVTPAKIASPDREVFSALLAAHLVGSGGWSALELQGYSHVEVARLMQSSAILVNTNLGEAFNTTVPEAMAAGCIAVCYEAFGGRDFLESGRNAHVFPNHYVFPLLDRLFDVMGQFESLDSRIVGMRQRAYETALRFTEAQTEQALLGFMERIVS